MKIIHFSDIHIHSNSILGNDPVERFQLALEHVKNNHLDADMFVITGDIAHHGDLASYKSFNKILMKSELPDHLYPKLMMGNHDVRNIFINYFKDTPIDQNGFVQYRVEQQEKRFLFLDTTNPKSHQGHYCLKRQVWLKQQLINSLEKNQSVFIFMHHNPLPLVKLESDYLGLLDRNEFQSILKDYKLSLIHI